MRSPFSVKHLKADIWQWAGSSGKKEGLNRTHLSWSCEKDDVKHSLSGSFQWQYGASFPQRRPPLPHQPRGGPHPGGRDRGLQDRRPGDPYSTQSLKDSWKVRLNSVWSVECQHSNAEDRDQNGACASVSRENGDIKFLTKGDNNAVDDRGLYKQGQHWLEKKDVVGRARG